jgi:hypothetical protein
MDHNQVAIDLVQKSPVSTGGLQSHEYWNKETFIDAKMDVQKRIEVAILSAPEFQLLIIYSGKIPCLWL